MKTKKSTFEETVRSFPKGDEDWKIVREAVIEKAYQYLIDEYKKRGY